MNHAEKEKLRNMRHVAVHLLAFAVSKYFSGDAKLGAGQVLEEGFYYDFLLPRTLKPEDLSAIEKEFLAVLKNSKALNLKQFPAEEAEHLFADQPFKLEILKDFIIGSVDEFGNWQEGSRRDTVSVVEFNSQVDLCDNPTVDSIHIVPEAAKLLSFSSAYWRGDSKNPSMQRIYGTIWPDKNQLDSFLARMEEAKKRDHRKIGKAQELFLISPEVGPGLPLWLPKGAIIRREVEEFVYREQVKRGYQFVYTPHVGRKALWETSGHWNLYKDKMFAPMNMEDGDYLVKPMSCPMHMMMFRSAQRSYKDLPIRLAETATVYRREQTGELSGLVRVRSITQDDAHIFLRPDQLRQEFALVLDQALYELGVFDFKDFEMWVSVRDPRNKQKYLGSDDMWDQAESSIVHALQEKGLSFTRAEGEAKFYGPALDVMLKDSIGRQWQCTTIQVDFMLPERFDLEYVDEDNKAKRPVVLHRALLGSMERFIGILIEHYAGIFPVWLAPTQVVVIPLSDKFASYGNKVVEQLSVNGVRVEMDNRSERMQYRIREAVTQKVPYVVVVGDRESSSDSVSVRKRGSNEAESMKLTDFVGLVRDSINSKKNL